MHHRRHMWMQCYSPSWMHYHGYIRRRHPEAMPPPFTHRQITTLTATTITPTMSPPPLAQ